MALNQEQAYIRRFVLDALRLLGAVHSEADGDLILATCQVTRPSGFFGGMRTVTEQLQLVFTPEGAGRHPTAELVCPGSHRLLWFIDSVKTRGSLSKQFLAEDLSSRRLERELLSLLPHSAPRFSFCGQRRSFVPHVLAILKLTAEATDKREELLPLVLNLADGTFRPGLAERLRQANFLPEIPYQRAERRRVTWHDAWRLIQAKALERAASYGSEWYRAALERLSREGDLLRDFYQETLAGAEDPATAREEYRRRLAELAEKTSPVIRIRLVNLALLYLPAIVFTVESAAGSPLPPIHYEPASRRVSWALIS